MPVFFTKLSDTVSKKIPYSSSSSHRSAQSINGITQVLSSSIQTLVSPAAIPAKFAQSIISFYTLFRGDIHNSEKFMSAIQGLMALAQLGLAIAALYEKENCNSITSSSSLCQTIILFDMVYGGTLAALWALDKMTKKDPETSTVSSSNP